MIRDNLIRSWRKLKDFLKRWWEFFSDTDVKWTVGAMMFLCWIVALMWLMFSSVANAPDSLDDQIQEIGDSSR